MSEKEKQSESSDGIEDLEPKTPSPEEEANTKGGMSSGINFFGGLGREASRTTPKMTSDSSGNEQVDDT